MKKKINFSKIEELLASGKSIKMWKLKNLKNFRKKKKSRFFFEKSSKIKEKSVVIEKKFLKKAEFCRKS